jgi:hypothetical protein
MKTFRMREKEKFDRQKDGDGWCGAVDDGW